MSTTEKIIASFFLKAYADGEAIAQCGTPQSAQRTRFAAYAYARKVRKEQTDFELLEALEGVSLSLAGENLIARRLDRSDGMLALARAAGPGAAERESAQERELREGMERMQAIAQPSAQPALSGESGLVSKYYTREQ